MNVTKERRGAKNRPIQQIAWLYIIHHHYTVMGTHLFIRYFVTVTVTSLVTAVTNEFLFSSACNEVTEAIGDFKND
jgi:hypothetical protein